MAVDIGRVLQERLDIPSVMFGGDHMDGDRFFLAQFRSRIDPFIEMILGKRSHRAPCFFRQL